LRTIGYDHRISKLQPSYHHPENLGRSVGGPWMIVGAVKIRVDLLAQGGKMTVEFNAAGTTATPLVHHVWQ